MICSPSPRRCQPAPPRRQPPGRMHQLLVLMLAVFVWAVASVHPTVAAEPAAWARYFPPEKERPADDAGWAELAKEFPHRVKRARDHAGTALQPPPATQVEARPGVDYLRVRSLAQDLTAIAAALERPRVVFDLRYIRGELEESRQFAAVLARTPLRLEGDGPAIEPKSARSSDQVTLCLVNRATSGPLEAVLDALQASGDVLLVGTQTAGDTGRFVAAPEQPGWLVITDDFRRAGGPSLLDLGLTPGLFVETSSEIEDAAYLAFDAGRPIGELLDAPVEKSRFDEARLQQRFEQTHSQGNGNANPTSSSPTTGAETPSPDDGDNESAPAPASTAESTSPVATAATAPAPFDRSLQRAVSTLVAHRVLHEPASVDKPEG